MGHGAKGESVENKAVAEGAGPAVVQSKAGLFSSLDDNLHVRPRGHSEMLEFVTVSSWWFGVHARAVTFLVELRINWGGRAVERSMKCAASTMEGDYLVVGVIPAGRGWFLPRHQELLSRCCVHLHFGP